MIVYISGKYTNGDISSNILLARKVAIELWERGLVVICPHLNTANFEQDCRIGYDRYITGDLEILSRCDVIEMLPNWEESNGARDEHGFALEMDMPIFYYPELPSLQRSMTFEQEAHLSLIKNKFIRSVDAKYRQGQCEHGGNLWDKPNLPLLMEEVDDLVVYAYTLREQMDRALGKMLDDDDARNILSTGNERGEIFKD